MRRSTTEYPTEQLTVRIANSTPHGLPNVKLSAPVNKSNSMPAVEMSIPIILYRVTCSRSRMKANIGANIGWVDSNASAMVGDVKLWYVYVSKMKYRKGCSNPPNRNIGKC